MMLSVEGVGEIVRESGREISQQNDDATHGPDPAERHTINSGGQMW